MTNSSDDTTRPKLNLELPPMQDIRAEYERRQQQRRGTGLPSEPQKKVVAVPMLWAATAIAGLFSSVWFLGSAWTTARTELSDIKLEVRELRENARLSAVQYTQLDKTLAVLQQRLEVENAVNRIKETQK